MNDAQDHAISIAILERQKEYHKEHGTHSILTKSFWGCKRCKDFDRSILHQKNEVEKAILRQYGDPKYVADWAPEMMPRP